MVFRHRGETRGVDGDWFISGVKHFDGPIILVSLSFFPGCQRS